MNEVVMFGIRVRFQNEVQDIAVRNLRHTLWLVPTQHLTQIRQIDVVPPLMMGTDENYAGGGSGLGYPRLSELCFDASRRSENFPTNLTLLHEIGHILDHVFSCLATSSHEHRTVFNAIPIPTTSRFHGDGEHYAIAYQQVISGSASEAVRAAVFASRAFDGVDTVRP